MEAAAACGPVLKETTERGRGLGEGSALGACLRAMRRAAGYAEKREAQGARRTGEEAEGWRRMHRGGRRAGHAAGSVRRWFARFFSFHRVARAEGRRSLLRGRVAFFTSTPRNPGRPFGFSVRRERIPGQTFCMFLLLPHGARRGFPGLFRHVPHALAYLLFMAL